MVAAGEVKCYNPGYGRRKKLEIWHVEDRENWQRLVARILTNAGYGVTTTPTAKEAKELIRDGLPNFTVAIIDGRLEEGPYGIKAEGKEVAELLKQQSAIAIIGLSDRKTPWADEYISKTGADGTGFEKNELLSALARLIEKTRTS